MDNYFLCVFITGITDFYNYNYFTDLRCIILMVKFAENDFVIFNLMLFFRLFNHFTFMIIVFYLITAVLTVHMVRGFMRKDRMTSVFCLISVAVTFLIASVINFNLHHLLRQYFGIPNTVVYALYFLILTFYVWFFREFISTGYVWIFFLAAFAWILSGFTDLVTDAGYFSFMYTDRLEEILALSGSVLLLVFYIILLIRDYYYFYSGNLKNL